MLLNLLYISWNYTFSKSVINLRRINALHQQRNFKQKVSGKCLFHTNRIPNKDLRTYFSLWCSKNQISKFNESTRQNQRKWSAFTTGVANLRPSGRVGPAKESNPARSLFTNCRNTVAHLVVLNWMNLLSLQLLVLHTWYKLLMRNCTVLQMYWLSYFGLSLWTLKIKSEST